MSSCSQEEGIQWTKVVLLSCINYMQQSLKICCTPVDVQNPWVISLVHVCYVHHLRACNARLLTSWVPVSRTISYREGVQCPWVISLVHVCYIIWEHAVTRLLTLWVSVSRTINYREDVQFSWVISPEPWVTSSVHKHYPWLISSVALSHIFSACENMQTLQG